MVHRTVPRARNYPTPNVNVAEVGKSWTKITSRLPFGSRSLNLICLAWCWERPSGALSFSTPVRLHKTTPWGWNTSSWAIKSLLSLSWLIAFCGYIFPGFRLNVCSFVLLKYVTHVAPGQPHRYICPPWGGDEVLSVTQRCLCMPMALAGCREGASDHGGRMPTAEADLSCLFSM